MAQDLPVADYDLYAGEADKVYDEKFTYFDYSSATTVDVNADAISNSIYNIIMTRIGSVPGKPDFGSNVSNLVFELMNNNTTADLLKNSILNALLKWEPRISISKITIKEIPAYNRIVADIKYSYNIMGSNVDATTTINLKD